MSDIIIQGLTQNNLKHVSFRIPKKRSQSLPECPVPENPVSSLTPLQQNHSGR